MRRKGKVDANQKVIVESLRKIPGISVAITSSLGHGYPDLNIGYKGQTFLVELKDGAKSASQKKLKPDQEKFKKEWTGGYYVAENFDQVLKIIGL